MKRHIRIALPIVLMVFAIACGGNSTLDNSEAKVFLTVNIDSYSPDIDICGSAGVDVGITGMSINSEAKNPLDTLTAAQDVNLTRWVITPYRTDGGTVSSPVWTQHDAHVYVEAGGSANLNNYRVFPSEYFDDLPLSSLYPENGGVDLETGNPNIRQSMSIQVFGRTVSGKAIATDPFSVAFNFYCGS